MPTNPSNIILASDLKLLQSAGFAQADPKKASTTPRLAVASRGKTKCGKSHWALMTTPEPVAYIRADPGSVQLVNKAVAAGRKVIDLHIPHDKKESQDEAKKYWQRYRNGWRAILQTKGVRTVAVDTISEMWELLQLAEFGKLKQNNKFAYGGINAEFGGLIEEMYYSRPDINIVLIQKLKKEYTDDKWDGKSYYAAGYNGLEYIVDLSIRHFFKKKAFTFVTNEDEATRLGGNFSGLEFTGDECSFNALATYVYSQLGDPIGGNEEYWDPDYFAKQLGA